jgi:putative transposase
VSQRNITGLPDIDYPLHDKIIVVTRCGNLSGPEENQFEHSVRRSGAGIREVHDDIWQVRFMDYDLGYFDLETRALEALENPFGRKMLPMS